MARRPKPWFWKARDAWYVTIGGERHLLGEDKRSISIARLVRLAKSTMFGLRGMGKHYWVFHHLIEDQSTALCSVRVARTWARSRSR